MFSQIFYNLLKGLDIAFFVFCQQCQQGANLEFGNWLYLSQNGEKNMDTLFHQTLEVEVNTLP